MGSTPARLLSLPYMQGRKRGYKACEAGYMTSVGEETFTGDLASEFLISAFRTRSLLDDQYAAS